VLKKLHELAGRIDDVVVLFPSSLRWHAWYALPVFQLSHIAFSYTVVCLSPIILMCRFQAHVCVPSYLETTGSPNFDCN
jgi:hypothetical protein